MSEHACWLQNPVRVVSPEVSQPLYIAVFTALPHTAAAPHHMPPSLGLFRDPDAHRAAVAAAQTRASTPATSGRASRTVMRQRCAGLSGCCAGSGTRRETCWPLVKAVVQVGRAYGGYRTHYSVTRPPCRPAERRPLWRALGDTRLPIHGLHPVCGSVVPARTLSAPCSGFAWAAASGP